MALILKIKRSDAAKALNEIRELIALEKDRNGKCDGSLENNISEMLETKFGIPPLTPCPGEAHTNGHIDNCSICVPHENAVAGPLIKVI